MALRIGVDVGGTFTKAVAIDPASHRLHAEAVVPTTHAEPGGVTAGIATALRVLLCALEDRRDDVEFVAFSTTQAMNALLEGDVAPVGVIGIGAAPDLRVARKRTRVGSVKLAAGKQLHTEHEFLDASAPLTESAIEGSLERLAASGCRSVAVSGAFSVDRPDEELVVAERARRLGLPACCGHDLSGTYGLEMRTVSAAVNASILPVVELTAGMVEEALERSGLRVPLLVLRGDGGSMSTNSFRRRPAFTLGSGPAAGVAAALHQLELADAIVLECGGTSSNVSVVKGGRPVLRSVKVMGRPTSIRSIDSWVVGAAGGSMARLGRRRIAEVGPRSAHIAGLPYAGFAPDRTIAAEALRFEEISPRDGDPGYAAVRVGEQCYALTATCAANALGLVAEGSHAYAPEAVLAAFVPLARRLRTTPEGAARQLLDGAVDKVAAAVREAMRAHHLEAGTPVVGLGGAAEALAPEVARRVAAEFVRPAHPEVLSSIGAALSLVRAEVARSSRPGQAGDAVRLTVMAAAERECVSSGAAPATVSVETMFEPREAVVRAVATGAVSLEAGAARRRPVSPPAQLDAAAAALSIPGDELSLIASNDFYRVFSENGSGGVAVVDRLGGVALSDRAKLVLAGEGSSFVEELRQEVEAQSLSLGVASMLPKVSLVCGPRIVDMSDARSSEEIERTTRQVLADHGGAAVAVLAR